VHPVGSYCRDISRCTVNKTLNLTILIQNYTYVTFSSHVTRTVHFFMMYIRTWNCSSKAIDEYSGESCLNYSSKAIDEYSGESCLNCSSKAIDEYSGESCLNCSSKAIDEYSEESCLNCRLPLLRLIKITFSR
jgi:hypothetical protein